MVGVYNPCNDKIWIDLSNNENKENIESHELGHRYTDKLSEILDNGSWGGGIKMFSWSTFY